MTLETRHAILDALLAVVGEEYALAVMEHRKAKKCPLTPLAARILAKQFALCPDPKAAVEEMLNRGWTGFKADWMARPSPQQRTGRRNFVDVAMDRLNGQRSVLGNSRDAQCVSDGQQQPRRDDGELRIGFAGAMPNSRH